ncbi:alpha-hydroxy-acid oxidizing protein [Rhodococcoides fascians]|jgi:isopentenyl diphosphate isomerase/L-lactate dehydrogenase-like FMN-dependent dehydrogenase|uniref:alpha-hydroxy-acid oxidizing protein n=1 Tax=Rhodococcoides fascians TaxID=1828 RepID=UPI001221010C|nr:alpha-hydroxy-acid oxidizing protein [Rhodococcus fascians]MDP9637875.1 isopentenyl diphosphate isomerase/L-lactate dehydrogenase-like FMN-dependent dehydrogenase [Rhodococcus cercidiphylli]MDQ0280902.1 isopentenyl diphosphate isomerase/L-lactate dehydrogenase-like FMN-dependent dehydrogenase [Rhodococcus fascians]RZL73817.1 MAG: alpha-hydroxy-acid oxidizing protein [Rhodococcus sp. (in: high G+C Gram-positive bacteria)]CAH0259333.1 Lactate 2-monooxygenase [Rhodococcus fascians]
MTEARPSNFSDHQLGIYAAGMFAQQTPSITTNLARLEDQAAEKLSPEALGYIVASAGSGSTARANRAAFDRWAITPRMLRSSASRDHACTVLGTDMPAPLLIAPVGIQTLAHPDGELATVRAAAELGVPYIHSTQASHSFEQIAEAGGDAPRWYQLYWPTDESVLLSFLQRAKDTGFTTLVLTLDTTLLGWRPADLDRGYLPFLANLGIENYLSDPAFQAGLAQPVEENPVAAAMHWAQMFPNPGLSWRNLAFLREHWDGPIVLKGICTVGDAREAAAHGVDGIVVSNHGGRQIDGARPSLDALPSIVEAVGDELTILFDSGVRTGADMAKALALGADAVLLGRPFLYGLALGGQEGVAHVLRCLLAEFDLVTSLSGHTGAGELGRDSIEAS